MNENVTHDSRTPATVNENAIGNVLMKTEIIVPAVKTFSDSIFEIWIELISEMMVLINRRTSIGIIICIYPEIRSSSLSTFVWFDVLDDALLFYLISLNFRSSTKGSTLISYSGMPPVPSNGFSIIAKGL